MVKNRRAEMGKFVGLYLSLLMYLGQDKQKHLTVHSGGVSSVLKSRSPTLGMCPWPMKFARVKRESREMGLICVIALGRLVLGVLTGLSIVLGRCFGCGVLG